MTRNSLGDPNMTSLYFVTPFAFNAHDRGVLPGMISIKFCKDVKG